MYKNYKTLVVATLFLFLGHVAFAQNTIVDINGTGNYLTVQAAIDAAPTGQTTPYIILIKNGKYREKITVPSTKPFIQLVGESVANTILYYDDNANTIVNGAALGTQNSASITINGADFSAMNITFANTAGDVGQAVAVLVNADRAAFKNCRFLGNQDTLYTKGSGTPRAYFLNCYIDGNTDFIFGSSAALFDSCIVFAKIKSTTTFSYITAPNTPTGQAYGYVFRNAKVNGNAGPNYYYLSRPWPSPSVAATAQKVVFTNTTMSNTVKPAGWSVWDANTDTNNVYNAEYLSKNDDGTLADTTQRVTWSHQLTAAQAATYTMANIFGTWSPCTTYANFCTLSDSIFAVSNFKGTLASATTASFSWNMSWPKNGVTLEVYRSTSPNSGFTLVNSGSTIAANYNYAYTDATLASGVYYYFLKAYKTGFPTQYTDTVMIQNQPNMATSVSSLSFSQFVGTPSASQSYTLTGASLTGSVTVTPPANYQVSTDNSTWFTSISPLVIAPTAGVVNSVVYVRLNAAATGISTGSIQHTSAGASTVSVAVTGNTTLYVAPTDYTLIAWPMTQNSQDSASIRYAGVAATVPSFHSLYSSNGTTVAGITAYSPTYGQAFGCTSNGDGSWGTGSGGPGGNLNRVFYEEFSVTANTGYAIKIDSFNLTTAFYNTSSSTKLAAVYSVSNFVSDSANVTGGTGPAGILAPTANGAFATPIVLANQTAGPSNAYSLALNGSTGVTIPAGSTLRLRIYYSCGSSSAGRYAMVKKVSFVGIATVALPLELVAFTATPKNNSNVISWTTANEKSINSLDLQKSTDGTQFRTIHSVKAGNNAGESNYIYEDAEDREATLVYYRLKMNELDNTSRYSKTIVLGSNKKTTQLTVYPNPVTDKVYVETGFSGSLALQMRSIDGKLVMAKTIDAERLSAGLDVSNLPQGVYQLLLTCNNVVKQVVIVKK